MRTVLFHIVAVLVTVALYCVIVPQARADLFSDNSLSWKLQETGVRMVCIYVCFLFVYYAGLQARGKTPEMPDEGAYGGYQDGDESSEDDTEDDGAAK